MNLILLLLTLTVIILTYLRKGIEKTKEGIIEKKAVEGPSVFSGLQSPDWVKNAVVYQVNVRQFSREGNLKGVENDLNRIKDLGVDILWLMPIFPICEQERKCDENSTTECWGSPYAPFDFEEVHEKYGTKQDFRQFIQKAHDLGMKVILDFVPNHTGFDSKWMREHPEWYVQKDGKVMPVTSDQGEIWADIAQFDLSNKDLREAWMQVHEYWVREFDLDGYREDCAWAISKEWWQELRERLNKIRPVYMLAEDEVHGQEQFEVCFETNYGWGTHAIMKDIYKGIRNVNDLFEHTESIKSRFGKQGWQLNFTQNHDENTWHGSETDLFGAGADAFTALCFTMEGMGLIYNGQEASLQQRLSFFNKGEINWSGVSRAAYFKTLTDLKHRNKALWNGQNGGFINRIATEHSEKVYAFTREKDGDMILAVFNLSDGPLSISLENGVKKGVLTDVFTKADREISSGMTFDLKPFEFHIFSNK
jgi:alpha-amylase